ncbi:MAG TPA: hypothetical protein VHL11_15970, partial [Phototrophicaceae bacterium]|nr:hypothetical protein [Phototrophicaceae bacterium]
MSDFLRAGRIPVIAAVSGAIILLFLVRGWILTSDTYHATEQAATAFPSSFAVSTVTPELTPVSTPEAWTAATRLIVSNRAGVWLRSEPSHLSYDEGIVTLPYQAGVRAIGKPEYEVDPG